MASKKKNDYRHIGMALIPPAAFTAVPNSPPPTPTSTSKKKKKKKVYISPIGPAMVNATSTVQAIGLGLGQDANAGKLQAMFNKNMREAMQKTYFTDEDETYAKIPLTGVSDFSDNDKSSPRNYSRDSPGPSRRKTTRLLNRQQNKDVYAVPKKLKKPSNKLTEEESKQISRSWSQLDEDPVKPSTALNSQLGSSSPGHTSCAQTPDSVLRRQSALEERMQLRDEQNREMILDLMQGMSFSSLPGKEKETSISEPAQDDQPVLENRRRNSNLLENHDLIQEIALLLKGNSMYGAEGVVLKQQIQEILDENATLKECVDRLNIELSKYQEKYGVGDLEDVKGLSSDGPKRKWLTDTKFLSPLFASYDIQLDTKDEIIDNYAEQLEELGKQMELILAENEILRKATQQTRADPFVSQQKWDNLKEQHQLMVEEIQLQMEQLELIQNKAKKMHVDHVEEVAKLSKRLALTDAQYQDAETTRKKLKEEFFDLSEKHDRLIVESNEKISAHVHVREMAQCKSEMENLKEQHLREMKNIMQKVQDTQKEKSDVLLEVTEASSKNKQLEGEIKALKEGRKKLQDQIENLQSCLDQSEKRELECQLHLANVVRVAERAASERETYAAVAEKEQLASQYALRQSMKEKWELGRMEESLKHYKIQLASHAKDTNDRLQEVEDSHTGQLLEYERKMAHMKKLLSLKQQALDDMAKSKKQIESELEIVWQSASAENKRIMEALHKSNMSL